MKMYLRGAVVSKVMREATKEGEKKELFFSKAKRLYYYLVDLSCKVKSLFRYFFFPHQNQGGVI